MWLGPVQHQKPDQHRADLPAHPGTGVHPDPRDFPAHGTGGRPLAAHRRPGPDGPGRAAGLRLDVTDLSLTPFVLPMLLVGIGFALTLSPMTAIALNTVPRHLAGMASATTNLLRDLGFALGPVLVGAVALSAAGSKLGARCRPRPSPLTRPAPSTASSKPAAPLP